MASLPTQRTLKVLRERGMTVEVVEKWIGFKGGGGIRKDLFGIIDLVAMDPKTSTIIGVQCGAGASHSKHRDKILASPYLDLWLACGGKMELWSWRKVSSDGRGSKKVWEPLVEEFELD